MKRRHVIMAGAGALAGGAVASPAIAQGAPEIRWRLASGFPPSADIVTGAAELFARHVGEATDGRFQIRIAPFGEVAPPAGLFDAVAEGRTEMAHTALYYAMDKDPAFGLMTSVPFGLNTRGTNAWLYGNGGIDLTNEVLARHGVRTLPGGNSGAQMGGWYRREVKGPADLKGLRVRTTGLAGPILRRLGAIPQTLPAPEIYGALERGTLDAADWIGPYDDEKLGFQKVAPFYYYPGWFEPSAVLSFVFNTARWNELPKSYRAIVEAAAAYANLDTTAKYDARNPAALRRIVGAGAKLTAFPQDVLDSAFQASRECYDELSGQSADFRKLWDSIRAFRGEEYLWFQVNEYPFDNFMIRARARGL